MWYPLLVEGTPFGRYRLLDLLGAGAMGEVHRAYDTGTDRLVAVKVLAREFAHDALYRKRFQREAQVAARLAEPHIVPIHDFGEIDGRLFLDMRLVQAPNLAELLAERGRLDAGESVEVIAQVAAALDAAHAEGLVHRDVKPSNILVTPQSFAYLIDFGIARSEEDTTVTTTGAVIGTFAYMAPERLADDASGARSDVYSLACVLYECLVGAKPYRGESMQRQIAAHLNDQPPLPSTAGLPRPFDAVIAKGMAKNPADRYETAGELAAAARAALWEPPTAPSPAGHKPLTPAVPAPTPLPATPDPGGPAAGDPFTASAAPVDPLPVTPATGIPQPVSTVPADQHPVPAAPGDPLPVSAATGYPQPVSTVPADQHPDPAAPGDPLPATAAAQDPRPAFTVPVDQSPLPAASGDRPPAMAGDPPPTPRPPWRAIVVMSVLGLAVAGTSALALTRDDSTLVTETPGTTLPVTSPVIRVPDSTTLHSEIPEPAHRPAPPVSVTESVPVTSVMPGAPAVEPVPAPVRPEPDAQPSTTSSPPETTTPPPATTTTTEPTKTTETETTTPVTTTPETTTAETTTPETTVTTTEEEGEEVSEDGSTAPTGGADATGNTIATSSAVDPVDDATAPSTETTAQPRTATPKT